MAFLALVGAMRFLLPSILTIQALYSHGTHAWKWWHLEHRVDWLSLGVIVALPIMLIVVIQDWRERKS
ncbi:MAG: hypothetical protein DMG67_04000 [Acidobacteria bacterium]|nr:MAG: hypothetical protein DMG67_04000 [Acidobacteriota bacterium]